MDKRRTKSLDGKCGSCRFFTVEQGRECTGFCSGRMKQKGRIERTYKCIGYEAGENAKQPQTNADRIRKWSDEEIAEFTIGVAEGVFELFTGAKMSDETRRVMKAEWLDWLKQEASE